MPGKAKVSVGEAPLTQGSSPKAVPKRSSVCPNSGYHLVLIFLRKESTALRVEVEIGGAASGFCLRCTRCQHQVEVQGTTERSRNFGLATLREQCPEGERNFYVSEGDDDA